jgi:ribonucleoside-diphosphate reductase alpha chain
VNIGSLRHATRILVILLDLQDNRAEALEIGLANLAMLLMALGLPYDGDAARATTAALAAIVTAEAYATSAELAALRGSTPAFAANHETVMRLLRNHRRAAYGDTNDYEKISVLPMPLSLQRCPDLALAAAAQRAWDEALERAKQHGLRHTHVTGLFASPALTLAMECSALGIAPAPSLKTMRRGDDIEKKLHPSVMEALARLGYARAEQNSIARHIGGAGTLDKAPAINHAALRKLKFDSAALHRIENYLPHVNDIRLAFTPWILGEGFCVKTLKIPAKKVQEPGFDLLRHLGFAAEDIAAANAFCYGHDTARGAPGLRAKDAAVFTSGKTVSAEAQIRMAAAVQGFVSGDVALSLILPADAANGISEKLLLGAWRHGLKTITLVCDAQPAAPKAARKTLKAQLKTFLHTSQPALPTRNLRLKAGGRHVASATKAVAVTSAGQRR